jgi:hypothetical protein
MDGGGGAEQWRLGRRSSGARRHGGGAGGEVVTAWRGGARGRGMVVEGGGAMRTAQWCMVSEAVWKVEDEQERRKIKPSRLYKDYITG